MDQGAPPLPLGYKPGPIIEGAGENVHFPLSPWKRLNYLLSQLLLEGPPSIKLHLNADCDLPLWDIDGS